MLTEQDRQPAVRIGELVARLGFAPGGQVDKLLMEYHGLEVVELG